MNSSENKRPVALEDLLRLKRAERPSPEFWARFESELRAKQLAAIVEKRRWWQVVSLSDFLRHRLLLGSAAALVVGAFSVAEYRSLSTQQPVVALPADSVINSPDRITELMASPATSGSASSSLAPALVSSPVSSRLPAIDGTLPVEDRIAEADLSRDSLNALPGSVGLPGAAPDAGRQISRIGDLVLHELSPAARVIASNLAAAKEAHPELTDRFFGVSGFEKRGVPSGRQMIDPLAQMRSPSELHRERLLASVTPAVLASAAPRSNERVARRISDQRLTEESMARFNARGNEFSLKF